VFICALCSRHGEPCSKIDHWYHFATKVDDTFDEFGGTWHAGNFLHANDFPDLVYVYAVRLFIEVEYDFVQTSKP
jgi:hypothetical protein